MQAPVMERCCGGSRGSARRRGPRTPGTTGRHTPRRADGSRTGPRPQLQLMFFSGALTARLSGSTTRREQNCSRQRDALRVAVGCEQPQQDERQRYVKERKPPQDERAILLEHVVGQPADPPPEQQAPGEVDVPEHLRQQHRDRQHARNARILEPERGHRADQRNVGEPEKVAPAVVPEPDRDDDRPRTLYRRP